MSISPNEAQRYASNSSPRDPEQNPISSHGLLPFQHDGSSSISAGSAQDSATGLQRGRQVQISGTNHGSFEDASGASKNVKELKSSNARKHSTGQNSSTYPQRHSFGQRGSSQFRSNNIQPNGRLTANVDMPFSDRQSLDSNDVQMNVTQAASRRREFLNANYLLNFHHESIPRSHHQQRIPFPKRQQRVKPYNKDLFLQANYRFVIYDSGSYSIESIDPDKMFPWEDVVCVRYSAPFPVQCPICLESLLCPQITSCGHIFCFSCILRYLLMGVEEHKAESWKKCPLCFSLISSKDLYTIKIDTVKLFRVGDNAEFVLLARAKDSQIPLLKSQNGEGIMPRGPENSSDLFSKFILSSDVELSVRDAKKDLTDWLCKVEVGMVDESEKLRYVCAALEQLEERMRKWKEDRVFNESPSQLNSFTPSSTKVRHHPNSLNPCSLNSELDTEHSYSKAWMVTSLENGRIHEKHEFSEKAIDGQTLILHPLSMKCLLHHFGSYNMLPSRFTVDA